MQKSLSPQPFTANSSGAAYTVTNQSPEDAILLAPMAGLNREQAASNSSGLEGLRDVARQLADMKAALRSTQSQLREMKQAEQRAYRQMVAWQSQFERSQEQSRIQQAQLTQAQNLQLERRLQHFVAALASRLMQNAIQRFVRARGSAVPEPARQPSTYIVPERENTGVYG